MTKIDNAINETVRLQDVYVLVIFEDEEDRNREVVFDRVEIFSTKEKANDYMRTKWEMNKKVLDDSGVEIIDLDKYKEQYFKLYVKHMNVYEPIRILEW